MCSASALQQHSHYYTTKKLISFKFSFTDHYKQSAYLYQTPFFDLSILNSLSKFRFTLGRIIWSAWSISNSQSGYNSQNVIASLLNEKDFISSMAKSWPPSIIYFSTDFSHSVGPLYIMKQKNFPNIWCFRVDFSTVLDGSWIL